MSKPKNNALLSSVILAASMFAANPVLAANTGKQPAGAVDKIDKATTMVGKKITASSAAISAGKATQDAMSAEQKRAVEDAVAALTASQDAIAALDAKDAKMALSHLEKAIGKIEIVLATAPDMALAPVGISNEIVDTQLDVKGAKKILKDVVRLLKEGKIQEARSLIASLASEVIIHVSYIPLGTYPAAIKLAVPLIQKNKLKEARAALVTALNAIVVEDQVIPLPIVRAEAYLGDAEKLAEKENRSKEEEKKLADLYKSARSELELGEVLGYGTSDDFKGFYKQIAEISAKTENGKHGSGFFDEIRKTLSDLRKKLL